MKNKNAKIERFLTNQTIEGLKQVIRFLLEDNQKNCNKGFILRAIEEYSIMYPELNSNTFSEDTIKNNKEVDTNNKKNQGVR